MKRTFVFDAYGTLFDVHSAARSCAQMLGEDWLRISEIWRVKQIEYAFVYSACGRMRSFRDITRQSLVAALALTGADNTAAAPLLERYARLEPFAEVGAALGALKERGHRLAILSNADPDMLDELVASARFADKFDQLLSVQAAGAFKPDPAVYKLALDVMGDKAQEIVFVSSNRWDIAGAKSFGFSTVWINRRRQPEEYPDLAADVVCDDLRGLLDL
ncbi:MAG: haloacid dehalogenase type II [Hyphomicrobium sp.]